MPSLNGTNPIVDAYMVGVKGTWHAAMTSTFQINPIEKHGWRMSP